MHNNNSNINYFNNGLECRYLEIGRMVTSAYTIYKKPLLEYNQWQNKPIPEETFLKWKEMGLFERP